MLGRVIKSLIDASSTHIPYRDSKLTRILQDSLGGNSKTAFILTASMATQHVDETVSTLRFGMMTKLIQNEPRVNKQTSVGELMALLQQTEKELAVKDARIRQLESQNITASEEAKRVSQGTQYEIIENFESTELQAQSEHINPFEEIVPVTLLETARLSDEEIEESSQFSSMQLDEQIQAELNNLQEKLNVQQATTETESTRADTLQKELCLIVARFATLEKENESLLNRLQTQDFELYQLRETLQDKESEIETIVRKPFAEAFMPAAVLQVPNLDAAVQCMLLANTHTEVHYSEETDIQRLLGQVRDEERRKFELEKESIIQNVERKIKRVVELEFKLHSLQMKYNDLLRSKGMDLSRRQTENERDVESLTQMYQQNLQKISANKVKKRLLKKRLARKDERLRKLEEQVREAKGEVQKWRADYKHLEQQAEMLQTTGMLQVSNSRVVKKIQGGHSIRIIRESFYPTPRISTREQMNA